MKTKQKKTAIITPEMLDGPIMDYREWSEKETKEFADYVATRKAVAKVKKSKAIHQKITA